MLAAYSMPPARRTHGQRHERAFSGHALTIAGERLKGPTRAGGAETLGGSAVRDPVGPREGVADPVLVTGPPTEVGLAGLGCDEHDADTVPVVATEALAGHHEGGCLALQIRPPAQARARP